MQSEPLVVAIILNWNGIAIEYENHPILERTLKTLKKVNYKNLKVIVADAESTADSLKYVRKNFKDFDLLKVKNEGFAYANNKAIEYAFKKYPNLDYVLLLNDDLIFNESKWLKKLVAIGERLSDVGIIGCKLKYPNGGLCEAGSYSEKFYTVINKKNKNKKSGYVESVIGAVFLIKAELILKIGLIDQIYLPFFKEEIDFCKRASINGYKTYYVNNTNITHLESYSVIKSNILKKWTKEQMIYFSLRNDWIFLLRWYWYLLPINLIYDIVQSFIRVQPEIRLRPSSEIILRLKFTFLGLIDAFKLYRTTKIQQLEKIK